jgi:hypothetical protein
MSARQQLEFAAPSRNQQPEINTQAGNHSDPFSAAPYRSHTGG